MLAMSYGVISELVGDHPRQQRGQIVSQDVEEEAISYTSAMASLSHSFGFSWQELLVEVIMLFTQLQGFV